MVHCAGTEGEEGEGSVHIIRNRIPNAPPSADRTPLQEHPGRVLSIEPVNKIIRLACQKISSFSSPSGQCAMPMAGIPA